MAKGNNRKSNKEKKKPKKDAVKPAVAAPTRSGTEIAGKKL